MIKQTCEHEFTKAFNQILPLSNVWHQTSEPYEVERTQQDKELDLQIAVIWHENWNEDENQSTEDKDWIVEYIILLRSIYSNSSIQFAAFLNRFFCLKIISVLSQPIETYAWIAEQEGKHSENWTKITHRRIEWQELDLLLHLDGSLEVRNSYRSDCVVPKRLLFNIVEYTHHFGFVLSKLHGEVYDQEEDKKSQDGHYIHRHIYNK